MTQYLVTVKAINLISDQEGSIEFIANENYVLSAFFYGESFSIGEAIEVCIDHLPHDIEWEIVFSENNKKKKGLEPALGFCSYYGYGEIESINPVIADFRSLKLDLGDWTNDERIIGEFIYWKINRLDISRLKPD